MSQKWFGCAATRVCLLAVVIGAISYPTAADASSHIRLLDQRIRPLLTSGLERSVTLRDLVDRLEAAPVLVFVRCKERQEGATSAAGITFLASTGPYRFLRIFLRCDLPASVQLPLLAHEFQHALEIAASASIVDHDSMRSHYEAIGYRSSGDDRHPSFETATALATERQVTRELAARPRSPTAMQASAAPATPASRTSSP